MTFFKRLILILAEIILFIVITALLLSPQEMLQSVINSVNGFDWIYRFAAALLIDVVLLGAIITQLRSAGTRYTGKELVVNAGESHTSVTQESVRHAIIKAVSKVEDIESVACVTKAKNGEAIVDLEVITSKDEINIPSKQREIDRAIKQVIVKQMGLKLHKPASVMIRLASDKSNSIALGQVEKEGSVSKSEGAPSGSESVSLPNGKHNEPVGT